MPAADLQPVYFPSNLSQIEFSNEFLCDFWCASKVGIIGHEFTICWQGREEVLSVMRAQKALLKWGYAVEDVHLAATWFGGFGMTWHNEYCSGSSISLFAKTCLYSHYRAEGEVGKEKRGWNAWAWVHVDAFACGGC